MNEVITKESIKIENLIYEIRGKQVMLDSDLARLYQCSNGTKSINLAVKRHINRFPERYMFQLTKEEYDNLRFQVETANSMTRTLPYAFTEQGVAMLATILRTKVAEEVSIAIMDAFVAMRKFLLNNADVFKRMISMENDIKVLNDKVDGHDKNFEQIFNKLEDKELVDNGGKVFSDGQIYDAYSLLIDIIIGAKKKIIVIDNYIDKTIFDILLYKNPNIDVEIYTRNIKERLDVEKFNLQYPNVTIHKRKNLHDRYIIIDDKILYHVGASLKDLGKKCFAISKLNNSLIPTIISQVERNNNNEQNID